MATGQRFWAAAALLAAGCAHGRDTARRDSQAIDMGLVKGEASVRDDAAALVRMLGEADASEPGRVKALDDGFLTIERFAQPTGPLRLRLRILPDTPVFLGQAQVGGDALQPGVDVRVYYRTPKGPEVPAVVGVAILGPDEARAVEDASHGKAPPAPPGD